MNTLTSAIPSAASERQRPLRKFEHEYVRCLIRRMHHLETRIESRPEATDRSLSFDRHEFAALGWVLKQLGIDPAAER